MWFLSGWFSSRQEVGGVTVQRYLAEVTSRSSCCQLCFGFWHVAMPSPEQCCLMPGLVLGSGAFPAAFQRNQGTSPLTLGNRSGKTNSCYKAQTTPFYVK